MPPFYYHVAPQQQPTQPQPPVPQQQQPHMLAAHSYPASTSAWPNPPSLPSLAAAPAALAPAAAHRYIDAPPPAHPQHPQQPQQPQQPQAPASAPPPAYISPASPASSAPFASYASAQRPVDPVYPLPASTDPSAQDVEDMLQMDAASPLPTPLTDDLRPPFVVDALQHRVSNASESSDLNSEKRTSDPEPKTRDSKRAPAKKKKDKTDGSEKNKKSIIPNASTKSTANDDHNAAAAAAYAAPDLLTTTVPAVSLRRSNLALDAQYGLGPGGPLSPSKSVSGNKPPSQPGKAGKSARKLADVAGSPVRETMAQSDSNSSLGVKPGSKLSQSSLTRTPPALSSSAFVSPPRIASPDSAAEPPSELDLNVPPSDDQSALISSTEPLSFGAPATSVFDYTQLEVDFEDKKNRIGVGTYGAVYIGKFYGELVAVKRILVPKQASTAANDPFVAERHKEAIRQFAREIRRYESISHPGIVRYLGITLPPDSSALLVTQLMHGGSLSGAISDLRRAKRPFNQSAIVRIAMQACGGLRALHQAKCTWGDAKPENILLSECVDPQGMFPLNAEARIADFGLSRSVGQTLLADTTLAGSGQPAGTYNYMAPESYSGVDRNNPEEAKSSDIFSFGMVIYEMLTLRTPFRRRQLMDVFRAVRDGERPPWPVESDADFFGPVPPELKDLVENCWQHEPKARPTADDVFHTLEEFVNEHDDAAGHRQMLGIASDPDTSDAAAAHDTNTSGRIQTMGSRQSSVSTAIAIGDGSVDFGGLTSTRESQRLPDGSDEEDDNDKDSVLASVPPQMSPITSPEPRADGKGDDTSGADNTPPKKQQTSMEASKIDPQLPQVESTKKSAPNKSIFAQHNAMQFVNGDGGQKAIIGSPSDGVPMYDVGRFDASHPSTMVAEDGSAVGQENSQQDLALLKTTEFIKHRDEIAMATATAASKIVRTESTGQPEESEPNLSGSLATSVLVPNSSTGLESTMDLSSSNNSTATASLRRKRRSRLQSIIEHAALALIEIQRRDESLNKTPPKQRKEAAEKKAQENARMRSERDALKTIDDAKKQGDFSMVLDEMRSHRHSQPVIKVSTAVLEQYCKDESFYLDICEEGGVEELVSAASLHGIQDEQLSVLFCDCIKALSEHYDHKVSHLVRAVGAPSAVIELLQHHKTAVKVQIAGCECLAVIASSSELSRSAVATLGGPSAVYQAMTKNNTSFKDVELARAALRAIRDIAQDNERAAEYLVQVAALDTVVRAADTFTTHGLERDILDALRAFSFYDGGRRNVIMSSGLKALTAIMVRNQEPDFAVQCCTFIREIARWRDHECEQNMLQSSISERITALMKTSNDIPGEEGARVAWYASHACTFLASFGSQSRQRLRQVGAIEMAINILRSRVENARVVHSATDALAELIRNEPESKAEAEGHNVVAVLTDALNTHREIARVKNALQWTLDYMTTNGNGGNGMLGGVGRNNGNGSGNGGGGIGFGSGARATPGAGTTDSRVVHEIEQTAANAHKGIVMPQPEPRRRKLRNPFARRNR